MLQSSCNSYLFATRFPDFFFLQDQFINRLVRNQPPERYPALRNSSERWHSWWMRHFGGITFCKSVGHPLHGCDIMCVWPSRFGWMSCATEIFEEKMECWKKEIWRTLSLIYALWLNSFWQLSNLCFRNSLKFKGGSNPSLNQYVSWKFLLIWYFLQQLPTSDPAQNRAELIIRS